MKFLTFSFRYQSNTAKDVLDTIMSIQPKDSGGGSGETRESVVTRQADDMLEKLPNDYIPHEVRSALFRNLHIIKRDEEHVFCLYVQVRARLQKMGALASMNIFLRQEIDRMQRVISLVRQTLTDLKLAIEGTIIMSEVYRNALSSPRGTKFISIINAAKVTCGIDKIEPLETKRPPN